MCPAGLFRAEGVETWELGCGGTASIHSIDNRTGHMVSFPAKESFPLDSPTFPHPELELWQRATRIVSPTLLHPNIAAPRAIPHPGDVQDYAPGRSLHELVSSTHAIPEAQVAELIRGVAHGLSYLHAHGIVHGDVTVTPALLTPQPPCPSVLSALCSRKCCRGEWETLF
jgi:serine/threonine protein kinase